MREIQKQEKIRLYIQHISPRPLHTIVTLHSVAPFECSIEAKQSFSHLFANEDEESQNGGYIGHAKESENAANFTVTAAAAAAAAAPPRWWSSTTSIMSARSHQDKEIGSPP